MNTHQTGEFETPWPEAGLNRALDLLRLNSSSASAILDIGAHEGETLSTVAHGVQSEYRYVALEPDPKTFAILNQTATELTNASLTVECLQLAAGPAASRQIFKRARASAVSGLLDPIEELQQRVPTGDHEIVEEFEVEVDSIDNLVAARGIDEIGLLKVDAEGYDLEVLHGAAKSLREQRVSIVLSECFFVAYRSGQCHFWDIASFLAGQGYFFVNLFDTRETSQGRLYTGNGLWVSGSVAEKCNYL